MSQIINTLSNQDITGLGKFRLRESLGKVKEMSVQVLKISKNDRNQSSMIDIFNSSFSPAIPMGNTSLGAGENTSMAMYKSKGESLLESKLLKASKNSALQETVSLLNIWILWSETEKELKILGIELKNLMKENKSLSLKLCQKN